ncbi:MAG: putaive type IV secretion system, signal peptidase TraF [Candidatus Desulfovibrio kirbyi]|uniref:Putaive type IV secretion system, signal peptidase TraF n=1 Tax=Candidatus Desulfovibrio kirbyi TaxID=2696086 RepID=A0A6L2R757_9BACT|nr:MAG: putaive type IV secretion system, signal peptidase TraF [Candidatus Desulfovibrio kirbyi]
MLIAAAVLAVLAGLLLWNAGYRVNVTPSLPKGIYRLASGVPAKGDLASFCLEGEFADLARERGYLQAGSCSSGLRPLLKTLAGLPGDFINPAALNIRAADSQGRAMPSVLEEGNIPQGYALALADHEGSFDGRYFGLVPLASLRKVKAVWLWLP